MICPQSSAQDPPGRAKVVAPTLARLLSTLGTLQTPVLVECPTTQRRFTLNTNKSATIWK